MSYDLPIVDVRLRSEIRDEELEAKVGKILTDADSNLLLTGPARVRKPDGSLLCLYLPGALDPDLAAAAYPALHDLRKTVSHNRGLAAGSARVGTSSETFTEARTVASAVVGTIETKTPKQATAACRLTAWTGRETEKWTSIHPLLRDVSGLFAANVPERYAAQARIVAETDPSWVVAGTVFSTITVNNSYATGVHTDKGDLDDGFSCLAVLRRGSYSGGLLTFPRYRIAADLRDRDLILMDAHEWHGNTALVCDHCGQPLNGFHTCEDDVAVERISIVCYYRTKVARCGTLGEEEAKRVAAAERRNSERLASAGSEG